MDNTIYERLAVPANRTEDGFYSEEDGLLSFDRYNELLSIQQELRKIGIEVTLKEAERYWSCFSTDNYLASWLDFPNWLMEKEIIYAYNHFEIKERMSLKRGNKIIRKNVIINSDDVNKYVVIFSKSNACDVILESNRYLDSQDESYVSNVSKKYKIYATEEEAINDNKGWSGEMKIFQLIYKEPNLYLKYISKIDGIASDVIRGNNFAHVSKKGEVNLRLKIDEHSYIDIGTLRYYNRRNYKGNNYVIIQQDDLVDGDFIFYSITEIKITKDQHISCEAPILFTSDYISLNKKYFTIFKRNPEKYYPQVISYLVNYMSILPIEKKLFCTKLYVCKLLFEQEFVTLEIEKEHVLYTEKQLREGTLITNEYQLEGLCNQNSVLLNVKYKDAIHISKNANISEEGKVQSGITMCGIPLFAFPSKDEDFSYEISSFEGTFFEKVTCENCKENSKSHNSHIESEKAVKYCSIDAKNLQIMIQAIKK